MRDHVSVCRLRQQTAAYVHAPFLRKRMNMRGRMSMHNLRQCISMHGRMSVRRLRQRITMHSFMPAVAPPREWGGGNHQGPLINRGLIIYSVLNFNC